MSSEESRHRSQGQGPKNKDSLKASRKFNYDDYKKLILKLKDNWQFPGTYLEKRGYSHDIEDSSKQITHRSKHSSPIEKFFEKDPPSDDDNDDRPGKRIEGKKFFYFPFQHISKKQSEVQDMLNTVPPQVTTIGINPESSNATRSTTEPSVTGYLSTEATTVISTTEGAPGFFQKLKQKITSIFSKGNSSSLAEDYYYDDDDDKNSLLGLDELHKVRRSPQKFFDFKYDDSWLHEDDDIIDDKRSLFEDKINSDHSILNTLQALTGESGSSRDILRNSDAFKSLTREEAEYILSFLDCFTQIKKKYFNDSKNITISNNATKPSKAENNSAKNSTNKDDTLQLDIEIETVNKTEGNGTKNANVDKFLNKLKFLAHLHHPVYDIGRSCHTHVDLKLVQEMIDNARNNLRELAIPGIEDDEKNNQTKCTPLEIKEISPAMDFEKSIAVKYLADSSNQNSNPALKSPYADNFLASDITQLSNEPVPQDRTHPKREALSGLTDEIYEKVDREISNVESPVDELLNGVKDPDYYYGDYDEQLGANGTVEKRKAKKKKKKRKKKKKKPKNRKDQSKVKEPVVYADLQNKEEKYLLPIDMTIDTEPEKLFQVGEEVNNSPRNYDPELEPYSELNDIKFRVNQEQEEAIEKFIRSLSSPPEVFNFDVDKYIKLDNPIHDKIMMETPSSKTFYEFIDPSALEKTKNNAALESSNPDEDKPEIHDHSKYAKRDILREYIKGVTSHFRDIGKTAYQTLEDDRSDCKQSQCDGGVDSSAQNFATDLDAVNYNQFKDFENKEGDDFIDKFYLLNDGDPAAFKNSKINEHVDKGDEQDRNHIEAPYDYDKTFQELISNPEITYPVQKSNLIKPAENSIKRKQIDEQPYEASQNVQRGVILAIPNDDEWSPIN